MDEDRYLRVEYVHTKCCEIVRMYRIDVKERAGPG